MSTTSITRRSKLQRDKTISSFGEVSEEEQSGPLLSPGSSIPEDLIVYRHSYGYSCKKPSNLHLLGTETLVFLSGNLIHFFNSRTLELRIRRSVLGTGIGCITVSPLTTVDVPLIILISCCRETRTLPSKIY